MHTHLRSRAALLLLACCPATGWSQEVPEAAAAPTTVPATATSRPASPAMAALAHLPPSPQRTLRLHATAMLAGDAAGVRQAYDESTAEGALVADAYGRLADSLRQLHEAAVDQYGPHGFDAIGFGPMFAEEIKTLERARLNVDGDTAAAYLAGPDRPALILARNPESGEWKIDAIRSFPRPERRAARIAAQAAAYEEMAAEVAAGKYRLATDARMAGRAKVQRAMAEVDQQFQAQAADVATRPAQ